MKVTVEELKNQAKEVFATLPTSELRSLISTSYLAFHYWYDDVTGEITDIQNVRVVPSISMSLYKNRPSKDREPYSLGYFQSPFDTQSNLFYQFLKYYVLKGKVDKSKLLDFFKEAKRLDLENIEHRKNKTLFNNVFNVYGREEFVSAVERFIQSNEDITNSVLSVSDAIDFYTKNTTGKTLYGATVEKVVMALHSPNGGLIPDKAGNLRYLYVGENSTLTKDDKSLEEAKTMLRSGYNPADIFLKTNWFYNKKDEKWRKPIGDAEVVLTPLPANALFIRSGSSFSDRSADVYRAISGDALNYELITSLVKSGWDTRLSDVLAHPTIYKHYPSLFNLPIFYATNSNKYRGGNHNDYSFFYNPIDNFLMIYGNPAITDLATVLLHETQHAIQRIEGYATGGNLDLARLIQAIGGENVKNYYFVVGGIVKTYQAHATSGGKASYGNYIKIVDIAKGLIRGIPAISEGSYYKDCSTAVNILLELYFTDNRVVTPIIKAFFEQIGGIEASLDKIFQYRREQKGVLARLIGQGFTENEANKIFFMSYEALLGEVEARDVQHTYKSEEELRGYLMPLSSESYDEKKITVLFDKAKEDKKAPSVVNGAVEKTGENKYTIHLFESASAQPMVHELGHILSDIIGEGEVALKIAEGIDEKTITELGGINEVFCELFIGYLLRQDFPKKFLYQLSDKRVDLEKQGLSAEALKMFDSEFDAVFHPVQDADKDKEFMSRIKFLTALNELIANDDISGNKTEAVSVGDYFVGDYFVNTNRFRIYESKGAGLVTVTYSAFDGAENYAQNQSINDIQFAITSGAIRKVSESEYWETPNEAKSVPQTVSEF